MFWRSLFVFLSFFFWLLYCLYFFYLPILITPLVSSNSSFRVRVQKTYRYATFRHIYELSVGDDNTNIFITWFGKIYLTNYELPINVNLNKCSQQWYLLDIWYSFYLLFSFLYVQMYLYSVSGVNELCIRYCLSNDILHCWCFIRCWNNLSFASNWVQFRLFMGPCYLLLFFFLCCWVLFCPRPVSCVQCFLCLWIVHPLVFSNVNCHMREYMTTNLLLEKHAGYMLCEVHFYCFRLDFLVH